MLCECEPPEKECVCEPLPPAYCVGVVFAVPSISAIGGIVPVPVAPLRMTWLWLGICETERVVAPTDPDTAALPVDELTPE